jgi:hypothetical protein
VVVGRMKRAYIGRTHIWFFPAHQNFSCNGIVTLFLGTGRYTYIACIVVFDEQERRTCVVLVNFLKKTEAQNVRSSASKFCSQRSRTFHIENAASVLRKTRANHFAFASVILVATQQDFSYY